MVFFLLYYFSAEHDILYKVKAASGRTDSSAYVITLYIMVAHVLYVKYIGYWEQYLKYTFMEDF